MQGDETFPSVLFEFRRNRSQNKYCHVMWWRVYLGKQRMEKIANNNLENLGDQITLSAMGRGKIRYKTCFKS